MNLNATLLGQMIMFFLFVWFTMAKVWPPIIAVLQERQKRIAQGLAAAEESKLALQQAQEQSQAHWQKTQAQASTVIEDAHARAAQILAQANADARKETDRMKALAQSDLAQQVESARRSLHEQVAHFSVLGAGRIIHKTIDESTHRQLIHDLIEEL
jgi:F-type H+-transporting ATPase subunit b